MMDISLAVDIFAAVLLLICVAYYGIQGFAVAVVNFFGTIIALGVAFIMGSWLAPIIFDVAFRPNIHKKAVDVLESQGTLTMNALLEKVLFFIPKESIEKMLQAFDWNMSEAAGSTATHVVDEIVQPFLVPILLLLVFVLVFVAISILLNVLTKLLKKAGKIPVLGQMNTVLGIVVGVLVGLVYCGILGACLWGIASAGGEPMLGNLFYGDSVVYRIASGMPWLHTPPVVSGPQSVSPLMLPA